MMPRPNPDRDTCTWGTLPEAARRFGIGVKTLRRRAAAGEFPVYSGGTAWPRVKFSEVEQWLRSTRVPVTRHASQRVAEVLAREGRAAG
jgi:excisionase family DNA binding protein